MNAFLQIVQSEGLTANMDKLRCTGGGAHKFEEEFRNIGVTIEKVDEMNSLVQGAHFLSRTSSAQV